VLLAFPLCPALGRRGDPPSALRREERRRHDGHAVRAPVGVRAGRDDHGVEEIRAELLLQPAEMLHVAALDGRAQLRLELKTMEIHNLFVQNYIEKIKQLQLPKPVPERTLPTNVWTARGKSAQWRPNVSRS
jgi:hypothetical protein